MVPVLTRGTIKSGTRKETEKVKTEKKEGRVSRNLLNSHQGVEKEEF